MPFVPKPSDGVLSDPELLVSSPSSSESAEETPVPPSAPLVDVFPWVFQSQFVHFVRIDASWPINTPLCRSMPIRSKPSKAGQTLREAKEAPGRLLPIRAWRERGSPLRLSMHEAIPLFKRRLGAGVIQCGRLTVSIVLLSVSLIPVSGMA